MIREVFQTHNKNSFRFALVNTTIKKLNNTIFLQETQRVGENKISELECTNYRL